MEKLYYSPKTGYTGAHALLNRAKEPKSKIIDWLETQPAYTLHKPARRKYPRNKVLVSSIDEQWQLDLCDLSSLQKYNDGFKFLLTCIDVFSKFAWAIPIKNKLAVSVLAGFKKILESKRMPNKVQTDAGTEFLNKRFQEFLKDSDITFFSTKSDLKASVVERFNRTLKDRMWRYFTKNNTYRYIDVLQDFIYGYNNSKHRTIGVTPANVNHVNEKEILAKVYPIDKMVPVFRFDIGDKVRVSKVKGTFEKGYLANFSEETFIVYEKLARNPPVYRIKDQMGEKVEGVFYEPELQKIAVIDDVYIVEKVLKTRKNGQKTEHFVKWRGYPAKFNSWVTHLIRM
jgi:transposase InsO family protein